MSLIMNNRHRAQRFFPEYQAGSGWNALLPVRAPSVQMPQQKKFDVIVIGAGFTGLAAARRIAELEPQSQILVIDATSVGEGSGGRNSGFLINLPHNTAMSGHHSPSEIAKKQIQLYSEGLGWMADIVKSRHIDCGWNHVGKYHAAATQGGIDNLKETLQQYQQWGVDYRELDATALYKELGTTYYQYGYHSMNNVFVQPAALLRGLADSLPVNVQLWEQEPVLRVSGNRPFSVETATTTLSSDRLVIANNGFARKLGLARDRVFTIYTYAAMTPALSDPELDKLGPDQEWGVIPANRLGTTLRKIQNRRFMVRSAYSYEKEQPLNHVKEMLQSCYVRRYPHMQDHRFEYIWGGVTALTRNGAVYFGQVKDGMYISIGCNGAGVLKGSMFGKLMGEMACGHTSPALADALGFERPAWLPPEPLRKVAVISAIQYQKHKAGLER